MAHNLTIKQGSTFSRVIRWEVPPIVYKAITAISKTAPARVTCAGHGIPDGWRVAIVSVSGMRQINAGATPPADADYHKATVVDVNTIDFNDINAADYSTYTSGGYLQYNTPVNLTGYTARLSIKDRKGGTLLLSLTTENGGIAIDTTLRTITLTITAVATAAITWSKGVYDLELVSGTGVVTTLVDGNVTVTKEVTV